MIALDEETGRGVDFDGLVRVEAVHLVAHLSNCDSCDWHGPLWRVEFYPDVTTPRQRKRRYGAPTSFRICSRCLPPPEEEAA